MWKAALPSIRSEWLRDVNAILLSAVCHLVALVALGLLAMASDKSWSDVTLVAQITDGFDAPVGGGDDSLDDELAHFTVTLDASADATGPMKIFDTSQATVADFAALETPLDVLQASGGLEGLSVGDGGEAVADGGAGGGEVFGVSGHVGSLFSCFHL